MAAPIAGLQRSAKRETVSRCRRGLGPGPKVFARWQGCPGGTLPASGFLLQAFAPSRQADPDRDREHGRNESLGHCGIKPMPYMLQRL